MSSQIITLAASLIALATSLLSIWVSTRMAIHKERRQVLWSKEVDRFFALEELAGTLVEELDSHQALERSNVVQALEEFRHTAGRFARYPTARQAIRDLQNALDRMFAAKRDHEDEKEKMEIRSELDHKRQQLFTACDEITEREKLL